MADSFQDRLIGFLNNIPAMSQRESRDKLLLDLPPEPVSTMQRHSSPLQDLTSIIQTTNGWNKLDSGEFALKIVINNARTFVKGLMQESELENFIQEFYRKEQQEIEIPFVIVAMTQDEAEQLKQQAIVDYLADETADELKQFKELLNFLKEHGITDFTLNYSLYREEWKPCICTDYSIKEVITSIITDINLYRELDNLAKIIPKFLSTDCFNSDYNKRANTWGELRELGCILVVDPISLFHPKVRSCLSEAEISSNQNTAILVLSPINPYTIKANQLIEKTISSRMVPAFMRFDQHMDKRCEIGIGDLRAIKRWFFSVLPETVETIKTQQSQSKNRILLRRKIGQPNGLDTLWRGNNQ